MRTKLIILIWAMLIIAFGVIGAVYAVPVPPNVISNVSTATMANNTVIQSYGILAGNISRLNFSAKIKTQTWAGVYGNVSGTITLEDSTGSIFYQWALSQPAGEIYAATTAPNWDVMQTLTNGNWAPTGISAPCYPTNISGNNAEGEFGAGTQTWGLPFYGLHELENTLGLNKNFYEGGSEDADGVNETFTVDTTYPSFYVGTKQVSGLCPEVRTYVGNATDAANKFGEVLLYDNTSGTVVFTAVINKSAPVGWDGGRHQFQMIIPENGHAPDTAPTTYYFFVELE